jgi:predicted CXXCH cytochrome family protein
MSLLGMAVSSLVFHEGLASAVERILQRRWKQSAVVARMELRLYESSDLEILGTCGSNPGMAGRYSAFEVARLVTVRFLAVTLVGGWLLLAAVAGWAAPPSNHDQQLGIPGVITGWHPDGYDAPFANGCAVCHGSDLTGGFAPSCWSCHGALWDPDQAQFPDSHRLTVTGNRLHTPTQAECMFCHDVYGDIYKRTNFYHVPGYGTPYESGCTNCHGENLDGQRAIASSCYWCHDKLWAGDGPPANHTVQLGGFAWHQPGFAEPESAGCTQCHGPQLDDGFAPSCYSCHGAGGQGLPADHTILMNGVVPHRAGFDDPYNNCAQCHGPNLDDGYATSCLNCHGTGGLGAPDDHTEQLGGFAWHRPGYAQPEEEGCAACHGPDLRGGLGPSCYLCHRREWADHDFSNEPWLPAGKLECSPCHEWSPSSGLVWNHELPTSTFQVSTTTLALVEQPNGNSARCLGCHEGAPNGPAIDDFSGNTNGTEYVFGSEKFGTDLRRHHPVSLIYDTDLSLRHGGLVDPATSASGLTSNGTVAEDMLQGGRLQCTSCHNPHDNSIGQFLVAPVSDGGSLCFKCHLVAEVAPGQHHIPGREDPWGAARQTPFACTMCHGEDLLGGAVGVACTECHAAFDAPNAPPSGHHMGDRWKPYSNCAVCHADSETGMLTGSAVAPSCLICHQEVWNQTGNTPPAGISIAEAIDVDGIPTVYATLGKSLSLSPVVATNQEGDALEFEWIFGDGSSAKSTSDDATVSHTYSALPESSAYSARLRVTDGVNLPVEHEFEVVVEDDGTVADTWDIRTTEPRNFSATFELRVGSLFGFTEQGDYLIGGELMGTIYWTELWLDFSDGFSWGMRANYFGNIDRQAGTMEGVVIALDGSVYSFTGSAR